jgi:DNA invertase Pin-like site-specific DNA recombinase
MEGIAKKKAEGGYKGRKPSIDVATIRDLAGQGVGATEIARRLGIGRASVYRILGGSEAASAMAEGEGAAQ